MKKETQNFLKKPSFANSTLKELSENHLVLPMVEYFLDHISELDLQSVVIVGIQHILETTHSMFRSLYRFGLKPENVFLLGKCYSTNLDVMNEMLEDGIFVSPGSQLFDSHQKFDDLFEGEVINNIELCRDKLIKKQPSLVIVLDDGGKFLKLFKQFSSVLNCPVIGIEQTSSGYELIKSEKLSFPVINVAKEPLKLEIESPMIAEAFCDRLLASLSELKQKCESFLIIGGGPIGSCIYSRLRKHYLKVDIFDKKKKLSNLKDVAFEDCLGKYDCYIGCTGKTSIFKSNHKNLNKGAVLASASSSDREFDAVFLRNKISFYKNCHQTIDVNGIKVLNSGFPVNFDGERENITPDLIQLTISLITAAIIQAATSTEDLEKIIQPINQRFTKIIQEFASLVNLA